MKNPGCEFCKHSISLFMLMHCKEQNTIELAQNYNRDNECKDFKHSNIILRLFRVGVNNVNRD